MKLQVWVLRKPTPDGDPDGPYFACRVRATPKGYFTAQDTKNIKEARVFPVREYAEGELNNPITVERKGYPETVLMSVLGYVPRPVILEGRVYNPAEEDPADYQICFRWNEKEGYEELLEEYASGAEAQDYLDQMIESEAAPAAGMVARQPHRLPAEILPESIRRSK